MIDKQSTNDDVLLSLQYFQCVDEFAKNYVYPSLWLLQPLFHVSSYSEKDWALNNGWQTFLDVVQKLDIMTCQINCTASYKYKNYCSNILISSYPYVQKNTNISKYKKTVILLGSTWTLR